MKNSALFLIFFYFLKLSCVISAPNDPRSSERLLQNFHYSSIKKTINPLNLSLKEHSQLRNTSSKTASKKLILAKDCLLNTIPLIWIGLSISSTIFYQIKTYNKIKLSLLDKYDPLIAIAFLGHSYSLVKSIQKYKYNEPLKNLPDNKDRKRFFKNFIPNILPIGFTVWMSHHTYSTKCNHHIIHFLGITLPIVSVANSLITDLQPFFATKKNL